MKIDVLDKGYILLVDKMGDDGDIAKAARVSYGNHDLKTSREVDERLIRRLWVDRHTSPFEMLEVKIQVKLPIFVMRQWIRHRTASVNEYSARFKEVPLEYYVPDQFYSQSSHNKQMSGAPLFTAQNEELKKVYIEQSEKAFEVYRELLDSGVSREQARCILPQNMYTQIVWKQNLKNLLHFCVLRNASDAQPEIQAYARAVEKIIAYLWPVTYSIFKEGK